MFVIPREAEQTHQIRIFFIFSEQTNQIPSLPGESIGFVTGVSKARSSKSAVLLMRKSQVKTSQVFCDRCNIHTGLHFFRRKKKILDWSSSRRICKNLPVSFPSCYFHTAFPHALKQTEICIAAWSALCVFRGRRLTLNKPLPPPPLPPPVHIIMKKRAAVWPTAAFLISFKQHWSFKAMGERDGSGFRYTDATLISRPALLWGRCPSGGIYWHYKNVEHVPGLLFYRRLFLSLSLSKRINSRVVVESHKERAVTEPHALIPASKTHS